MERNANAMTDPLYVTNEDPVNLDGSIDGAASLQILHGTDSLADYGQKLYAEHDDLAQTTGIIRIKIIDFAHGGDNWEISVEHLDGSTPVTWSRGTDHAYYDFGPMTSELQLDIRATSDASPAQNKDRTIYVKTTPINAQPDRPRR
jgi:hypothetical protein